ncbi:MAG: 3'-5' exonuclease [Gammaproteobacteria bacterium]
MFHAGLLRDPPSPSPGTGGQDRVEWSERLRHLASQARDPRLRAFYQAGGVPASTPLQEVPLLALDVETTGLDPVQDGIVSIGVVPMTLDCIHSSRSRHWLLKPRVPLQDDAVTIHGITHQQIQHAPDLDQVLDDVLSMMAGHVMVVHCRDIERRFLESALRRRIDEGIEFPVIDTMELEARLYRQPVTGWRRWWRPMAPPVSIRLAASRARYGLPRYRLHHALTDALASAELLQAQVADRFTPASPVSDLWR